MSVKYEVTAITGKYTDRDGNEKSRYAKLGVVIEGRNGPMLKIESIPVGWDGWAYLNEPRDREQPKPSARPQRQADASFGDSPGDPNDDIPFARFRARSYF